MISAAGVGSGLDLENIISQLVAAEAGPTSARLNQQEAGLQVKISAFGSVSSALSGFQSALGELTTADVFQQRSATSSDIKVLSPTATDTAATGTYKVDVTAVAQAQKLASDAYASTSTTVGGGTLTFRFGTYSSGDTVFTENTEVSSQTVNVAADATLEEIRDAVNTAGVGVTASIVNDGTGNRLTFTGDETGAGRALEITATDDDGNNSDASGLSALTYSATTKNVTQTQAAQDAALTIDGLAVTSSSNTVTGAIPDVNFDLRDVGSATITVAAPTSGAQAVIKRMVDAFNTLAGELSTQTGYNADTKQAGALLGDSAARGLENQLRGVISGQVTGISGTVRSLADLGITTGENGSLSIDTTRLNEVLESNLEDVITFFTDATSGFATQADTLVGGYLGTDGILTARTDGLQTSVDDIADQRADLQLRIGAVEARFRAQFTAMDTLVAQLQVTGDFLTQQLASLPKPRTGSS